MTFSLFQIFYCSRTHSQLSQFVKEIQKTKFSKEIRLASLASRSNLCINESVLALKSSTLINERCLELQKSTKKGDKKSSKLENDDPPAAKKAKKSKNSAASSCQFFKSGAIASLRDKILLEVQDIEQLVQNGRKIGACPYYASRKAVENAQVTICAITQLIAHSRNLLRNDETC
jgi:chromosome transmission fidelity protein 1